MARNLTEYSKNFFNKITENYSVPTANNMRVKIEGNEEEFERAKNDFFNLQIDDNIEILFEGIKTLCFTIDDRKFIMLTKIDKFVTGDLISSLNEINITPAEINTGIFLALVADANLGRTDKFTELEFENLFLFQQNDNVYSGHSLEDMKMTIEDINIFEIGEDSILFEKNQIEIAFYILTYVNFFIRLPLDSLLSLYRKVLATNYSQLPYENLFFSLTATHWKHAFLEVYRCIERLYVLPRVIELKNKLGISESAIKIARSCFLELGWKSKEQDALKRLIKENCTNSLYLSTIGKSSLFQDTTIAFEDSKLDDKSAYKVSEKIYMIRNSFVHQFHADDNFMIQSDDMLILIEFLLEFTNNMYGKYQNELQF